MIKFVPLNRSAQRVKHEMKRAYNIPIFIPHEGCPHDCVFCNQRKITGQTTSVTVDEVRRQIAAGLTYLKYREKATVEVAFFGGSFTGLPLSVQEGFLKAAGEFYPEVDGIRVSTRPDYISREVLELFRSYGGRTVELGVQSSDDGVLAANRRGHRYEDVPRAVTLLRDYGLQTGLQMMAGMYGSTPEKDLQTARDVLSLHPDCVRIYPTVTLKDTALEQLFCAGKYVPYTLEQAVELCKQILGMFRRENIAVIRLGLHAGEDLQAEGSIVAGPYHPAFGELVESRICRDKIEEAVLKRGAPNGIFEFYCPPAEVSKYVGHKRSNVEYFKKKYGVTLKIKPGACGKLTALG